MYSTNPKAFAAWFNEKYPDAYRSISIQDLRDLITCKLIGRYGYYFTAQDGEIIRGLLEYEQL